MENEATTNVIQLMKTGEVLIMIINKVEPSLVVCTSEDPIHTSYL